MQLVRYSVFTLTENKVKWRKGVKIMSVWFRIKETSLKYRIFMGMPVKCETKRNKSKRNSPKRNEIYLVSFRFRFVSVNFVSFRWISFLFRFAFYRYPVVLSSFQMSLSFTSFVPPVSCMGCSLICWNIALHRACINSHSYKLMYKTVCQDWRFEYFNNLVEIICLLCVF